MKPDHIALVLSGGNALAAFQGGAWEVMAAAGLQPELLCGTSAGAINAALLAGNPPERRLEALQAFWRRASLPLPATGVPSGFGGFWRSLSSRVLGVPGVFVPRLPPGAAFYDLAPLETNLAELADFARVAQAQPALRINAVDSETGAEMLFDTRRQAVGPAHVAASASLPPDFPPRMIDSRPLLDGGLVRNVLLPEADWLYGGGRRLCVVLDCFSPSIGPGASLDDLMRRRKEIPFAAQAATQIGAALAEARLRKRLPADDPEHCAGQLLILHVIKPAWRESHSDRPFDHSEAAVARRWREGCELMRVALARLQTIRPADTPSVLRITAAEPDRAAA